MSNRKRIRFYVDGLNFYYGVAKPYRLKWVDIEGLLISLVRKIEPEAKVEKIFLFTAIVSGESSYRQKVYLQALQAHSPSIRIIKGYMQPKKSCGPLVGSKNKKEKVEIQTYEEKSTDVNLACHILNDAHTSGKKFDLSCLVSNDSDLSCALKMQRPLGRRVLLITPRIRMAKIPASRLLRQLVRKGDRITEIDESEVQNNLLPKQVGKWTCPKPWEK